MNVKIMTMSSRYTNEGKERQWRQLSQKRYWNKSEM